MKIKGNLKLFSTLCCAIAVLTFVLFFSCEGEYLLEEKTTDIALGVEVSTLKSTFMIEDTLWGPVRIIKEQGKPKTFEAMVSNDDFVSFLPPYKIYLKNGDDNGGDRVIKATVKLDGEVVFSSKDISKKVGSIEKEISLSANSKLEVDIGGKSYCYMDVYISGQKINSWAECYGGSDSDIANCIIQTEDGGYVVAGSTKSSNSGNVSGNHGGSDFWVVKFSSRGVLEWQKCYGGSANDYANCIIQTTDGGFVVAGHTKSNDDDVSGNDGGFGCWVIKLSSGGSLEWQKCYGGSSYDYANCVIQTTDGGYALAGFSNSCNSGRYWVVKLSSGGSLEWQKCFGGVDCDEAYSIIQTVDGGYAVAGYSMNMNNGNGGSDYLVVKLSSSGVLEWQKCYGGSNHDLAHSIIQTIDGGYAVAGYVNSNNSGNVSDNHGGSDYWIIKLSTQGILEWQKCFGGVDYDEAHSIIQTIDGGYVVAGFTYSNDEDVSGNHGDSDYWVIKLSSSGSLEWQKCYGGSATDIAYSLIQNTEGGYVVAGYSLSNSGDVSGNYGDEDYWVIKLDNNGNLNIP